MKETHAYLWFYVVGIVFVSHSWARTFDCTQAIQDSPHLTKIHLVGETHGPKAQSYWNEFIKDTADVSYFLTEGACLESKEQQKYLLKGFDQQARDLFHPTENCTVYGAGILMHVFDAMGRVQEIEKNLIAFNHKYPGQPETEIVSFAEKLETKALGLFIQMNGLPSVVSLLEVLNSDPVEFDQTLDNYMFPFFDDLMKQGNLIEDLKASLQKTLGAFQFNLKNGDVLKSKLLAYDMKSFAKTFIDVSNLNPKKVRPELFRFVKKAFVDFLEKVDLDLIADVTKPKLTLLANEYSDVYLKDSVRGSKIKDEIMVEWRDSYIAQNIYDFYCHELEKGTQRPIYVRLGENHLPDLKKKLGKKLGEKVEVNTFSLE